MTWEEFTKKAIDMGADFVWQEGCLEDIATIHYKGFIFRSDGTITPTPEFKPATMWKILKGIK